METIKIQGKDYVTVNERIIYFREHFPGWSLISELVSVEDGIVIMKASVIDDKGIARATGFAYEKEGSSFINKTSYVENCETSAWGRALASLGIGIVGSVASAEEVGNAVKNQDEKKTDADDRVGVGKHKGLKWSDVPDDYIEWAISNVEKGKTLRTGADKEYDRRYVKENPEKEKAKNIYWDTFQDEMKKLYTSLGKEKFFIKLGGLGYEKVKDLSGSDKVTLNEVLKGMLKGEKNEN